MKKNAFHIAFGLGALAVLWVTAAVATTNPLVLVMTMLVAAVYLYGARELLLFRQHTAQLRSALQATPEQVDDLGAWLHTLPQHLQNSVRLRVDGERIAFPGPAFTPYLVGLLVMLGMLGTFLGMVVTLNGAVFALEGTSSVQGMRAAFSEPIKGLGLAFGTSVAGVATSAMLGLMSSLARRERAHAAHLLDGLIQGPLCPFSQAYQREATYRALQQQSQALPQVVAQLEVLMQRMEQHSQHMGSQLQSQQDRFHQDTHKVYTELAQSVQHSLQTSLSQSMQVASDSIRPVVQSTLADMAAQAQSLHDGVQRGAQQLLEQLGQSFETRTQTLLQSLQQAQLQQFTQVQEADQQRQSSWTAALQSMASQLQAQWQTLGAQTQAQQAQICEVLGQTAAQIRTDSQAHTQQTTEEVARLLASNDTLVRERIQTEAKWAEQHAAHTQALAELLRTELTTLRDQEAQRGDAALARLAALEGKVAEHLSTLGTALEAPISRLIETASEAPKAAADVIAQLRQEISVSVARDNALLEERTRILETLSTLLDAINHASSEQRGVIDAMVNSSQAVLAQASDAFTERVNGETDKLGSISAQVTASAIDVASLGESFGVAVRAFTDNSEKLSANLERIEAAMAQSMQRSDEQLAYYVAQARELIDLSISSQKDVLDALAQRPGTGAA